MAIQIPGFTYSLEASADLSASQFLGVVVDANGRAAVGGANAEIAGVLQNDPNALGVAAAIQQDGVSKFVAGAAVAAGASLTLDASGRVITGVATNPLVGIALDAAGGAAEIISVLLKSGTA